MAAPDVTVKAKKTAEDMAKWTVEVRPMATVANAVSGEQSEETFAQSRDGLGCRSPSGRLASQKQLPSTGVLFAAQQLGGEQESPDSSQHTQDADRLPLGIASDGVELVGRSDQCVQSAARGERLGQSLVALAGVLYAET